MGINTFPEKTASGGPQGFPNLIAAGTISSSPNTKTISIPAGTYNVFASAPVVLNGGSLTNTFLGSPNGVTSTTTSAVSTLNTHILPSLSKYIEVGGVSTNASFSANHTGIAGTSNGSTLYMAFRLSGTTGIPYYLYSSTNYGLTWSLADGNATTIGSTSNTSATFPIYDATINRFTVMYHDITNLNVYLRNSTTINSGWTTSTNAGVSVSNLYAAVATGNGLICGLAGTTGTGTMYSIYSTNGTSLSNSAMPSNLFNNLKVANGVLFAISGSPNLPGQFYTSTNGTTWTLRTFAGAGDYVASVAFGQSTYVIQTTLNKTYTSTDLTTWTLQNNNYLKPELGISSGYILSYINGAWFQPTTSSAVYTTANTLQANQEASGQISYNNPVFIVPGNISTHGQPGIFYCSGDNSIIAETNGLGYIVKISAPSSVDLAIYGTTSTAF